MNASASSAFDWALAAKGTVTAAEAAMASSRRGRSGLLLRRAWS